MGTSYDTHIDWLHGLADQPPEVLLKQVEEENRKMLHCFVRECLPTLSVPADLTAEECAAWIRHLSESEREWSRVLGATLLAAAEAGDNGSAIQQLRQFASSCPWTPFKEIADDEAERYLC